MALLIEVNCWLHAVAHIIMCVVTFGAGAATTNLMAEQNGINSVLVTWTPPSPPPSMGYRITVDSTDFSAGIGVTNSSATSRTISLQSGVRNIRMRALSQHYPSEIVGPVEVTVKGKIAVVLYSRHFDNLYYE